MPFFGSRGKSVKNELAERVKSEIGQKAEEERERLQAYKNAKTNKYYQTLANGRRKIEQEEAMVAPPHGYGGAKRRTRRVKRKSKASRRRTSRRTKNKRRTKRRH